MEMVLWIVVTALVIALLTGLQRWRLRRALARGLPAASVAMLSQNIPVYARMPAEVQSQMRHLVVQFLHQKKFVGCAGLELNDEMRITIAGQACLLLLNRPTRVYPALDTILVYPTAFVAEHTDIGPGGIVTRTEAQLLGESWGDGRVILAWDHVRRGAADWSDGENVVLHEFAHQLDSESGWANGAPFLGSAASYRSWAAALSRDFAALRRDADDRRQSVFDHYGASDPAEFFAVATETFFDKPHQMAEHHAALYEQFEKYYRVDPRAWLAPPDAAREAQFGPDPLKPFSSSAAQQSRRPILCPNSRRRGASQEEQLRSLLHHPASRRR